MKMHSERIPCPAALRDCREASIEGIASCFIRLFIRGREMRTIRQHIIELLSTGEMNAIELSQDLGIGEKEVYGHLPHIARSVGAQGKTLIIRPSSCLTCGYVFKERRRFTRPGRCARCKGTFLQRPAYLISGP